MSLYTQGIVGAEDSRPLVAVNVSKAGDTFWTAVKWLGAGVTLVVAWREARMFYRARLRDEEDAENATEVTHR